MCIRQKHYCCTEALADDNIAGQNKDERLIKTGMLSAKGLVFGETIFSKIIFYFFQSVSFVNLHIS
jgi:uncharacterized oligopeptide transporter (OPT) family protein